VVLVIFPVALVLLAVVGPVFVVESAPPVFLVVDYFTALECSMGEMLDG
jgi:hypothetical protein